MNLDELFIRRAVVLVSALGYWGGVWVQARRVRKRIGRSPNLKPRGLKERLLWLGWLVVVVGWIALPFLAQPGTDSIWLQTCPVLLGRVFLVIGTGLVLAGYAGTLWCYAAMGDRWRIGVDLKQIGPLVTHGPYGYVRHPIYLFQIVMLSAVVLLLPTGLALAVLALHMTCAVVKATDEEAHLLRIHGNIYRDYLARTGRLWPPLWKPVNTKDRTD